MRQNTGEPQLRNCLSMILVNMFGLFLDYFFFALDWCATVVRKHGSGHWRTWQATYPFPPRVKEWQEIYRVLSGVTRYSRSSSGENSTATTHTRWDQREEVWNVSLQSSTVWVLSWQHLEARLDSDVGDLYLMFQGEDRNGVEEKSVWYSFKYTHACPWLSAVYTYIQTPLFASFSVE